MIETFNDAKTEMGAFYPKRDLANERYLRELELLSRLRRTRTTTRRIMMTSRRTPTPTVHPTITSVNDEIGAGVASEVDPIPVTAAINHV